MIPEHTGPSALRTTESPLDMPSARRLVTLMGRALRFRCPHCGKGWVLTRGGSVKDHCMSCGLRFQRSEDDYFSGAMFFGMLLGEGVFALGCLLVLIVSWPNVPWTALTYGAPLGMLLLLPILLPFSKVVWLAVDVLIRPVMPEELLVDRSVGRSASRHDEPVAGSDR
jgi:uncharacterized protein (DUF983 family)